MNLREYILNEIKSSLKINESGGTLKEGVWPKSKLSSRFQFLLSDELKKKFKGVFYVIGYDLYHNDKIIMKINPDKDSVNSIINHVSKNRSVQKNESINESSRRANDFYGDSKHGKTIHSLLKGKWNSKKVEAYLEKLGADSDVINARLIDYISKDAGLDTRRYKTLGEQMPALIKQLEVLYKDFLNEAITENTKMTEVKNVNWSEFYKMAKDKSGYNPSFEKKYGAILDKPHVQDALKTTKDFKSFMKHMSKFEVIDKEQIDEKLITFSNRAPYGQIVFMAGGAGCFDGDTLVKTESGYSKITDIKVGDKIYTFNEVSKIMELDEVVECYNYKLSDLPENQKMLELEFDNGTKIKCTENHEFYINGSWVMAKNLELGVNLD